MFRARRSHQIDGRHPLVRLAGLIDWGVFEDRFGQLYHPHIARPSVRMHDCRGAEGCIIDFPS
jgi:transposase, IS5 family